LTLAKKYSVPGVGANQYSWTDDVYFDSGAADDYAIAVSVDGGSFPAFRITDTNQTVCVTDPSA
jgi:hypothetical protein